MNFRKAGLLIVGVLLVVLYFLNRNQIELLPQQFSSIHTISATGADLPTVIRLKNSNLLSSTIKSFHEKFYLNGVLLGILDNELNQGIPGLKTSEFPANIRFSQADFLRALGPDSLHPEKATITVEGDIQFQNLFTSGKIDVHQTAAISNEK